MPFNFDTEGSLEDRETPVDKAMFLVAWLVQGEWDPNDGDEMETIREDLDRARQYLDDHLMNIPVSF